MHDYLEKGIIIFAVAWLTFFALPGPRQVYDWFFGSGISNPQYLFADSHKEACRRLRRVVEDGKANLYIENLPTHKLHISFTQRKIRALVVACSNASWDNSLHLGF